MAEPEQGLWADALREAGGDQTAARIVYIGASQQVAEAEDSASQRLKRALSAQEVLASPAPSYLLWAIVSSLATCAFIVLGIIRGGLVLAAVTGTLSGVFWWNYRRSAKRDA